MAWTPLVFTYAVVTSSCLLWVRPASPATTATASTTASSLLRGVRGSASGSGPSVLTSLGALSSLLLGVVLLRRRRRSRLPLQRQKAAGAKYVHLTGGGADVELDVRRDYDKYVLNTYNHVLSNGAPAPVLVKGHGARVVDGAGRTYLDFSSGIAVTSLGHSDAGFTAAIAAQAERLTHTSNMFLHAGHAEVAERLVLALQPWADKAFLCNSGTEANEAALKFAARANPCREKIVAFEHSFHGRTLGALAVTHKAKYREQFSLILSKAEVEFLRYASDADLSAIDGETAAVIIEPVQGEGGVMPAPKGLLERLRRKCDEVGALLIFDEVQSGLGRCGAVFAHQHPALAGSDGLSVIPDMVSIAKPLAGGIPAGAVVVGKRVAEAIHPGDHGTTFGGNPLACAGANYVLEKITHPQFIRNVLRKGDRLMRGLRGAVSGAREIRGLGLLVGMDMGSGSLGAKVIAEARKRGLIVLPAGGAGEVVRIAPPLNVTDAEIDEAIAILRAAVLAASMPTN